MEGRAKLMDIVLGRGSRKFIDVVLIAITGALLIFAFFTIEQNLYKGAALAICGLINFTIFTYVIIDQRIKALVELLGGEDKLSK